MLRKMISPVLIASAIVTSIYPRVTHALDLNLSMENFDYSTRQMAPRTWTAINLGSNTMTSNNDVKVFLEVVHLTDTMLAQMFKESNEDYDKYEVLKDKWLNSHFKEGLKQLAYIQMVQKYATRSPNKKEWKAFKTTETEYYNQVEALEGQVLKKLLDEGKGIVYARKRFGEELIKVGYPHKKNQDGEDLYWDWYKLQKKRIKENFRIKELQKFEYLTALGYEKEFYVRPVELFDFAKKVTATIEDKIQEKRITPLQIGELVSENPALKVMLKGITFYGPETTKLTVLKEKAPNVYSDFLKKIDSNVISFISDKLSANIKRYQAVAAKMAHKYKTSAKLEELSKEMKKKFITSNDYSHLMMSKIYGLASVGIKDGTYLQKNKERKTEEMIISKYLKILATHATKFLNNETAMLTSKNNGVRFEDKFSSKINNDFHANSMSDFDTTQVSKSSYLNEVRILAHWVLTFQIKKAALNTIPKAHATLYDVDSFEGQGRIEKFLKNKQYKDKVEKFKNNKLKSYWNDILAINPTGHDYYTGSRAINFVLGIKEEDNNQSLDILFKN